MLESSSSATLVALVLIFILFSCKFCPLMVSEFWIQGQIMSKFKSAALQISQYYDSIDYSYKCSESSTCKSILKLTKHKMQLYMYSRDNADEKILEEG